MTGRDDRRGTEEEDLARLRRTWANLYVIPGPRRRWWFRREWAAFRRGMMQPPLTAPSADALGQAIARAWAAEVPLEGDWVTREAASKGVRR